MKINNLTGNEVIWGQQENVSEHIPDTYRKMAGKVVETHICVSVGKMVPGKHGNPGVAWRSPYCPAL